MDRTLASEAEDPGSTPGESTSAASSARGGPALGGEVGNARSIRVESTKNMHEGFEHAFSMSAPREIRPPQKLPGHASDLISAYNIRKQGVAPAFKYEQARSRAVTNFEDQNKGEPIQVGVGAMAVAPTDREMYTDGLFGCAALFIKGDEENSLVHLVSNNDHRTFGYWANKYNDPVVDTTDRISEGLKAAKASGKGGKVEAALVVNGNIPGQDEHVQSLVASLEAKIGVKIKVIKVPYENAIVYYTPEDAKKLMILGAKIGKDGASKVDYVYVPVGDKEKSENGHIN